MALTIVRPEDTLAVGRLTAAIYGAPGVGKTTLSQTADRPLTLDFDAGAHRAARRGDVARIQSWADVAGMDADALDGYRTLIVDTVGASMDMLTTELTRKDPALSTAGGTLTLQGYGALRAAFGRFLRSLLDTGKDVVLVSHATEQSEDGRPVYRLDIAGSSKNVIHKEADLFGFVSVGDDGSRYIDFRPGPGHHGKDPAGFGRVKIPASRADTMARMIAAAKKRLSAPPANTAKTDE